MPDAPRTPSRLLVTGPAGSGKTHLALGRIRDASTVEGARGRGAADPDRALLVLPTYAQVLHLKRVALSRWDTRGILDAPFTTFTAAGERFVEGYRVRSLPSADERDRLMEEALRQADVELFERVADRVGFRARLLRLVKEVKQSGLPVDDAVHRLAAGGAALEAGASARLDGFLAVFRAYEALLRTAGLDDHEDSLRRLLDAAGGSSGAAVPRLLVVDGFDDFTPVEERILRVLADRVSDAGGEVVVTLPFDPAREALFPGAAETRARWLASGFEEHALSGFPRSSATGLAALADRLFQPDGETLDEPPGVAELVAGDHEDEAEQIAREARRFIEAARNEEPGALPLRGWRDVGVVVRRTDDVAARFDAAFKRMGVPLRIVGAGRPLASEPLVRALRGPLQLLAGRREAGRFDARALTTWIRWRLAWSADAASRAALDRFEIRHRKKGYPATLAAYADAAPEPLAPYVHELLSALDALDATAKGPRVYAALASALDALAPLPDSQGLDAEGRPVDPVGDRRLAWATVARSRLGAVLRALEAAVRRTGLGQDVDAAQAVDELFDAVERTRIALPDRRLDAVTLMDAEEARYWELELVFVAGLEEGRFPLHPREDVLLRDRDREALAEQEAPLRLPLARDREARERRLFYGALTRARSQLVLCRSAYDEDGDPKGPSSFLRDVRRVVTPTRIGAKPSPGRVAVAREVALATRDWRLFAAANALSLGAEEADRRLAVALLDALGSTASARAARDLRARGEVLHDPSDALPRWIAERFKAATRLLSVSRLNQAVVCPYRFFLADVVGVPEDDVPFEGPGFDLRKEGSALHRALEIALREPEATPAIVAARVAEHEQLGDVERRLLLEELARVVILFRRREADFESALAPDPRGLEYAFGDDGRVQLGDGAGRFALRGKIDRIDTVKGVASLIDYKSSASGSDKAHKAALNLEDLQLPLYAKAVSAQMGVHVRGVEWAAIRTRHRRMVFDANASGLFEGRREGYALVPKEPDAFADWLDEAEAKASSLVAEVRAGVHAKAPIRTKGQTAKTCAACAWKGVCRPDLGNPEPRGEEADA
ncbi:MAG: PD-(D/E)XK nuclease family protein [Planctomycetota bacterium]|nr:PD-(D/E)XK nuclease family protein [Planctomycetota bacterium]